MVHTLVETQSLEKRIFHVRGHRVMIDRDLARLYGVETRDLNKAVSRNMERFPGSFAFRLTKSEFRNLKFHFGTSSWGGTRKLPMVFTEHGVAMLSAVLKSPRAVSMSILVIKAFVRLREMAAVHKEISDKLRELQQRITTHDEKISAILEALHQLMQPPSKPKRKIGF